jgi:hypothetical protein
MSVCVYSVFVLSYVGPLDARMCLCWWVCSLLCVVLRNSNTAHNMLIQRPPRLCLIPPSLQMLQKDVYEFQDVPY